VPEQYFDPMIEGWLTVIDGRPELVEEVHAAPVDLQRYLSNDFKALLSNRNFLDALPGHLLPDMVSQQRASLVLGRIKQLVFEG
jgi:hypothetical protein